MTTTTDDNFTTTTHPACDSSSLLESEKRSPPTSSTPTTIRISSAEILIVSSVTLLRILIGFQPHSGQDNFHGARDAYGGDYEAQRHWMEVTWHLPIGEWYRHDVQYWGLDYPPLTAYVSFVCGMFSSVLVGPETVALYESRGYEDSTHKAYMRGTVLILDMLIYYTAVWTVVKRLYYDIRNIHGVGQGTMTAGRRMVDGDDECQSWLWIVILALAQPAIIIIDHGHFQYNTVALGLALWSFHFMTKGPFRDCIAGSILFCLALNFKQMTLYYAPAVFAYLLGRCFLRVVTDVGSGKRCFGIHFVVGRFLALGLAVIMTFVVLWWPFAVYPPLEGDDGPGQRIMHVVSRIFPFQRGLFEGKVSNLWCALSTRPISIRRRLPERAQPYIALAGTLIFILPACVKLFFIGLGKGQGRVAGGKSIASTANYHLLMLLWGTTSTGLAFFLASFQVHEKSILMALSPASILLGDAPAFICWFSLVAIWTLWPLIQVDRLEVAYFCSIITFFALVSVCNCVSSNDEDRGSKPLSLKRDIMGQSKWSITIITASIIAMAGLHIFEVVIDVPPGLPDLFPVLWSISGCGMFTLSLLFTFWALFEQRGEIDIAKKIV